MRSRKIIFSLLSILGLAACSSSKPAHYYVLDPLCCQVEIPNPHLKLGIAPVQLADYLKRKAVVVRTAGPEVKISRLNYWAGTLEKNISEVLTLNLSNLLGTDNVFPAFEYRNIKLNRILYLDILQFDAIDFDTSVLVAKWQIFDANGKLLVNRRSCYSTPAKHHTYAGAVAAMSKNLCNLAEEIAAAV